MYDTYVTVVGNVLNPPEWRRTTNTKTLVTTFKIASTSRRLNKETGAWIDGNSLRVRVTCWRALASNVASSVTVGDPLIVTGRLYTRDWTDEHGVKRLQYELEATAIGHDLTRGRNRFERVKSNTSTSVVEDERAAQRIGGEPTEPVPADQAPAQFEDAPYEPEYDEPMEAPVLPVAEYDAVGSLRGGGFSADPLAQDGDPGGDPLGAVAGDPGEPSPTGDLDPAGAPEPGEPATQPGSGRRRGVRRTKVSA